MDSWTILGTAWALAMDAFAVATAIAAGLSDSLTARHTFRLSWHFGLFQSMMTVIGWFGGAGLATLMGGMDKWLAFGVLSFLGLRMIRQSRHPEGQQRSYDPTRGWSLVGLSLATSLDALAVGISLGLIGVDIWLPAGVIGLVAMVLTYTGTRIGKRAGSHLGQWAEGIGGIILLIIGSRILIRHLAG
ncbi:MAG: manganese efflux pump [Deltaproteobacteria bacterium]|nr:manganese efflux pump [Deltaproteobacteria bacterium]